MSAHVVDLFRVVSLAVGVFLSGCSDSDSAVQEDAIARPNSEAIEVPVRPEATEAPNKPETRKVDVLLGDYDATSEAYYVQQFSETADIEQVRPGLEKLETLWEKMQQAQASREADRGYSKVESYALALASKEAGEAFFSYLEDGDTFLFREIFRFSACKVHVARTRFEHCRKIMYEADSADAMAAVKAQCQEKEEILNQQRMLFLTLKKKLEDDYLDTSEDQRIAGFSIVVPRFEESP